MFLDAWPLEKAVYFFFGGLTSEWSTTGAGPEMAPSFRTRQKWTIINVPAMSGMAMQCQM